MSLNVNWKWLLLWGPLLVATGLAAADGPAPASDVGVPAALAPESSVTPNGRAPFSLDDWESNLPTPVAPTRTRLVHGDDGNTPLPKSPAPPPPPATASVASTRLPQTAASPQNPKAVSDDERLADIAMEDRDFFQALAKNPKTWSNEERDHRAQAIHDKYYSYLVAFPRDVNALVLYGKLLYRTGQGDMAYEAFRHADALEPGLAVVKQQMANYLAENGQYQLALDFLHQATALAPNEPLYHYQIGELLNYYYESFLADKVLDVATLNKTMAAEFARAAELAPQQPAYAWRYAESYYDMASPDWKAALAAWTALVPRTTNPTLLEMLRLHCARALLELGRLEEAGLLINQPVLPALEASRLELARRLAAVASPAGPTAPAKSGS